MTDSTACASGCGRPAPGSTLCATCTASLRAALELAASIEDDLNDATARLLRHGHGGKSASSEPPLPIDLRASDAAAELRSCLSGWVGVLTLLPPPAGSIRGLARWMLRHLQHVVRHEAAADILFSVRYAVDRAVMVLDGPPERHPAGTCSNTACGRQLLAPPDADEVTCQCGMVTTGIAEARAKRAAEADVLGSSDAISRALAGLGIRVAGGTIRTWVARHRITPRADGSIAMSDVLAMVAERDARKVGR